MKVSRGTAALELLALAVMLALIVLAIALSGCAAAPCEAGPDAAAAAADAGRPDAAVDAAPPPDASAFAACPFACGGADLTPSADGFTCGGVTTCAPEPRCADLPASAFDPHRDRLVCDPIRAPDGGSYLITLSNNCEVQRPDRTWIACVASVAAP